MNMLDTYISEVGRHLPLRNRKDIEAEIRSTLEDILEERSRTAGKPQDEEMIIAVLKEYGSPEHVAASYQAERYLIGPRLFPLFWMVLRIVLAVTGVIALVAMGFKMAEPGVTFLSAMGILGKTILEYLASALSVLGNIVLVFAVLQHFLPDFKIDFKEEADKWDPRSLKDLVPSDRISIPETIIEIIGACIAIVLFNFYPQIFRYTPSLNTLFEGGTVIFLPVLTNAFFRYVPWLTVLWGLTIILDVVLLRQGFWKKGTRLALLGLKIASIVVAIFMLTGPALVAMPTESEITSLGDAAGIGILFTMANQVVRVVLALVVIFGIWDVIKTSLKLANVNLPALKRK